MREYTYKKIDAFASSVSQGNPAACIYLQDNEILTEDQMLSIAVQHKGFVSEVVYCSKTPTGLKLTYYSSECEVDFCGHGTIACIYSLLKSTKSLLAEKEIVIQTNKKGSLTVYNHIPEQDAIFITAPTPQYLGTGLTGEIVAGYLGVQPHKISQQYPIDLINGGLNTLIVPIETLAEEISIFPQQQKLKQFCLQNQLDIILIFSTEVKNDKNIAHTRVFAPKFGYLEDPATGSGNSAFGYYMLKNNIWSGDAISIEQGGNNIAYNNVRLMLHNNAVLFGGCAVDRIVGKYYL